MGSGAKSYMRKGFLIDEYSKSANISLYMRRALVIYDFAPDPSGFPFTVYEENFILFFISADVIINIMAAFASIFLQ
jgi:hypothetical protein